MLPLIIVRPGVLEAVSAHTGGGGDFRVQLCLHAAWSCRRWQKGTVPGSAISRRHLGPPRSPGITLCSVLWKERNDDVYLDGRRPK